MTELTSRSEIRRVHATDPEKCIEYIEYLRYERQDLQIRLKAALDSNERISKELFQAKREEQRLRQELKDLSYRRKPRYRKKVSTS